MKNYLDCPHTWELWTSSSKCFVSFLVSSASFWGVGGREFLFLFNVTGDLEDLISVRGGVFNFMGVVLIDAFNSGERELGEDFPVAVTHGDLLLVERVVVDPDEEGEDSHRTGTLVILLQQAMSGEFFARNSVWVWL